MDIYLIGAIVVACLLFVVVMNAKAAMFPYEPRGPLLTPAELNFYKQLVPLLDPSLIAVMKVRIADIVDVKKGIKKAKRISYFNQVACKHFDFVLIDERMNVVCAIELNDSSHQRKDRIERDKLVRKVCKSAGIPLAEIKASRSYVPSDISSAIKNAIQAVQDSKKKPVVTSPLPHLPPQTAISTESSTSST